MGIEVEMEPRKGRKDVQEWTDGQRERRERRERRGGEGSRERLRAKGNDFSLLD